MKHQYNEQHKTLTVTLRNGAEIKIREDEDGDLEIRETTHRYLLVKPQARNMVYVSIEDPMKHPRLIEFDLPTRQTADLVDPGEYTVFALWEVPMTPRNTSRPTELIEVRASTAEDAISKALSLRPGHTWGKPKLKNGE